MSDKTFQELTDFIINGMCFSYHDAIAFAEKKEMRELSQKEKDTVGYLYDRYRHFGF